MDTRLSVEFLGGVADGINLTGACTSITVRRGKETTKILVDVGLVQCSFNKSGKVNRAILESLDPKKVDYVILTHPHIDHVGRLPLLVKYGFGDKGRVICTEATGALLPIMLKDSAIIQISEARWRKKRLAKKEKPTKPQRGRDSRTLGSYDRTERKRKSSVKRIICEPLYSVENAQQACDLVKNGGYEYGCWIKLTKTVSLKFYPSGHVLGGAICVLRIETDSAPIYLGFSGDLGREDGIILPPPELPIEPINYWFIESTYGGETHPLREDEIDELFEIVRKAKKDKRKIIIPSFALERTQEIIYLLSDAMWKGIIPKVPIFLDSPMATKLTAHFAEKWGNGMFTDQGALSFNPFDPKENPFFKTIMKPEDSAALVNAEGPYIVIAGSGMCDAGRVRNHLRHGLENPDTIVCIIGYMAGNSLGRKLKDGLPIVRMNGHDIVVKAEINNFGSFSAHADSPFLTSFTKSVVGSNPENSKGIFIVHGEGMGAALLKAELMKTLPCEDWLRKIIIPRLREEKILH